MVLVNSVVKLYIGSNYWFDVVCRRKGRFEFSICKNCSWPTC